MILLPNKQQQQCQQQKKTNNNQNTNTTNTLRNLIMKKGDLARLTKLSKCVCVLVSVQLITGHSGKIRMANHSRPKGTDSATSKAEIQSKEWGTLIQDRSANHSIEVVKA